MLRHGRRILDQELVIGIDTYAGQLPAFDRFGNRRPQTIVQAAWVAVTEHQDSPGDFAHNVDFLSISFPSQSIRRTTSGIWPMACVAHERHGS